MYKSSVTFRPTQWSGSTADFLALLYGLSIAGTLVMPFLRTRLGASTWSYILPIVAGVIVLLCRARLARAMSDPRAVVFVLGLAGMVAWLTVSHVWSLSLDRYQHNVRQLILLLAVGAITLAGATRAGIEWATRSVVVGGAIIAGYIIGDYRVSGNLRGYGLEISDSYLTISMMVGSATVLSGFMALYGSSRRWLWVTGAIINAVGLSLGLGRGPLLFAAIIIGGGALRLGLVTHAPNKVTDGSVRARGHPRTFLRATMALTLVGTMVWGAFQVERTGVRLQRLLSGSELDTGGRGMLWSNSLRGIADAPIIGSGIGSSGLIMGGSEDAYPHNFVLQLLSDGGIIALAISFLWMMPPLAAVCRGRWRSDGLLAAWFAAYLFLLLEYSKSYDFYGCRGLVVAAAITVSLVATQNPGNHSRLSASV